VVQQLASVDGKKVQKQLYCGEESMNTIKELSAGQAARETVKIGVRNDGQL
jgi:hypothetical protein